MENHGTAGWLGFRPLISDPALRALLALSIVYYFAYGPLEPALAVFVRDRLGSGAAGFGLLWTAFGIGAMAGLLLVKTLSRRGPGLMNALSVVAFGLATAPLALVHSMPAAIVFMALGGIAWGPYVALEASVIQRRVPARHLAGAFAARRAILWTAAPLGVGAGGLMLRVLSPETVIGLSAGACVLAGLACLLMRDLRAVRDPDAAAAHTCRRRRIIVEPLMPSTTSTAHPVQSSQVDPPRVHRGEIKLRNGNRSAVVPPGLSSAEVTRDYNLLYLSVRV